MRYDVRPRLKEVLVGELQAALEREGFDRFTLNRIAGRTRRESDLATFPASEVEAYDSAVQWFDETIGTPPYSVGGNYKIRAYHVVVEGQAAKKTLERTFAMAKVGLAQTTKSQGTSAATETMAEQLTHLTAAAMHQSTGLVGALGESHLHGRDYAIALLDRHHDESSELQGRIMELQAANTELRIRLEVKEMMDARPSILDPDVFPAVLVALKEVAAVVGAALRPLPEQ